MPPPPPAAPRYRRLPGRTPVVQMDATASASLHLGDDHLLQVVTNFCTQNEQHFAYRDIQAILVRRTSRGVVYSCVLGALAGLPGLFAWAAGSPGGRLPLAVLAGVFLALLILNTVRGATCRCHLQTAAGPHALPSLSRMRPARRALDQIAERVEAAQAAMAQG